MEMWPDKKIRTGVSFFTRLRHAWLVLCGKTPPGFNFLPYEKVDVKLTTKKPIHLHAKWWAREGYPIEVAKGQLANEFMRVVSQHIKYTVEPCEDGQGNIVRGDLWIIEGEPDAEA